LLAPDYIQHNPAVPTGAHAIIDLIPVLAESGIKVDVHRVIAEDDMVVVHSTYSNAQLLGSDTLVAFDVFRIEEGKVAEHWDNLQALAGPNPSGHSMTDGTTDITDEDKTAENKALVAAFVETVLQGGDASRITDFISTKTYIQHNPQIADGLDGLSEALAGLAEAGIDMVYARTPLIVAQGNFVFTGSEGRLGAEPTAFFDLFRLENGRIVEHWDTVSPIPERFAHGNGKF
ncbi:MAG TPA: hypothetical protein ENJ68_03315, partial [Devosia sp.]|nr:hypothetical protein [Devosia sp.]